ncbi:MAG: hypothetical protein ABW185_01920, partial [Sedimenticola sp.]
TKSEKTTIDEKVVAADVEFLSIIRTLLENGKILSMDTAHEAYYAILEQRGCIISPSRRAVRSLITENIDDVDFICASQRNMPDRFCLSAAKIAAIEAAVRVPNIDDEMKIVFQCAKLLRKDVLCSPRWTFDGTLQSEMNDIIPAKLQSFLQWLLIGVANELSTEQRATNVKKQATLLAQQIMYQTKSERQVHYHSKTLGEKDSFHHRREYPSQVGTGILVHQKTRSSSLVDYLHHIGVSVEYARVLRIETQLAQAVLNRSAQYDVYVPPGLVGKEFIFLAIDNSDFSEDTPEGKDTLHATAMVVYQRTSNHASPVATDVRETAAARSLPLNPQLCPDILPRYILAKTMPQCPTYNAIGIGATSDITKTPIQDDFTLSVGRSLIRSREDKQHIPSWSAYNSVRGTPQKTLTTVAMMPLLAAPAHEYSTLLTVLKQAQKITTLVMGESHKTVITFDLQLYERAVKLQMHSAPALYHLVFRIGEMHTVLASLRAVGSFIEESGIDDAWMEADLYGSATTHQILEGRHMKRALNAHSITSSALSDMHLDAFLNSASECSQIDHSDILEAAIQENTACAKHRYDELDGHHRSLANAIEAEELAEKLDKFDREMESRRPTFKFARDYMRFMTCIFLFIRATREGNWNLHLASLKELCKYFFAHDRLNYARMVPLYLVQMEKLQASDPDIYAEFLDGNFCVYKREVPFCAIGPDHAIEHVNKLMKISGGLKGLTQNASAMTRWFVMAHELGRLSSEAEDLAGSSRHKSTVHHDLSDASLERYERNVKQLKDVMKVNDPFMVAEGELVNIITNAVMPDEVMYAIMKHDSIGKTYLHIVRRHANYKCGNCKENAERSFIS